MSLSCHANDPMPTKIRGTTEAYMGSKLMLDQSKVIFFISVLLRENFFLGKILQKNTFVKKKVY